MVEAARTEAKAVLENNLLAKFPFLQEKIQKIEQSEIHFE